LAAGLCQPGLRASPRFGLFFVSRVFAPAPGLVFSSSAGASRQPPVRPLFFVSRVFAPAPGSAFSLSAGASRQPPVRPLFFVSRGFAPAPGLAAFLRQPGLRASPRFGSGGNAEFAEEG